MFRNKMAAIHRAAQIFIGFIGIIFSRLGDVDFIENARDDPTHWIWRWGAFMREHPAIIHAIIFICVMAILWLERKINRSLFVSNEDFRELKKRISDLEGQVPVLQNSLNSISAANVAISKQLSFIQSQIDGVRGGFSKAHNDSWSILHRELNDNNTKIRHEITTSFNFIENIYSQNIKDLRKEIEQLRSEINTDANEA